MTSVQIRYAPPEAGWLTGGTALRGVMAPSRAREQSEKYHVNKSSRTCGILVLMVSIADFQSAGDGSSPLYPSSI